jgi:hypothetical protein
MRGSGYLLSESCDCPCVAAVYLEDGVQVRAAEHLIHVLTRRDQLGSPPWFFAETRIPTRMPMPPLSMWSTPSRLTTIFGVPVKSCLTLWRQDRTFVAEDNAAFATEDKDVLRYLRFDL